MFRHLAPVYSLFVILAGLTLIREATLGPLASWERAWNEWLQVRSSPPSTPGPVTLIEINADTLQKRRWPWPAEQFSIFMEVALAFESPVLAVETPLDFERGEFSAIPRDASFEQMLQDRIHRAPKLVLGGRLGWSQDAQSVPTVEAVPVLRRVAGDLAAVPEFTVVEAWATEGYRLSSAPGWANVPTVSPPAPLCPLVLKYRGQPVPSFVLQMMMHWQKATPEDVDIVLGSHVAIGETVRIPVDAAGRMRVNLRAPFNRAEFDNFVLTRQQMETNAEPVLSPVLFKNKALLLARTDPAAQSVELEGRRISPGELFAAAAATVHSGQYGARIGVWFDWALILVLAVVGMWMQRLGWVAVTTLCVLFATAYILAAMAAARSAVWLPGLLPLGLVDTLLLLRFAIPKKLKALLF